MGATDVQIARLFQRRIGLDALFGGLLGFVTALLVIILLGTRLTATGSDLLAAISLPWSSWLILTALPVGGVLLATLAARWTVLRSLGSHGCWASPGSRSSCRSRSTVARPTPSSC
jgi:cell division transport system permease protein